MSKRPWMPLYVADYLADTMHLTTLQNGAYMLLIMHYWKHGSIPKDDNDLATITKMKRAEWRKNKAKIISFFEPETGKHSRIEAELARQRQVADSNREKAAKAANKRWNSHAPSISQALLGDAQSQSQSYKKEKKESWTVAKATRPESMFDVFWRRYPKRKGGNPKAPAEKLFNQATKSGVQAGLIVEAIAASAGFDREKIGTEYIPQAVKWLRDKRWEEHTPVMLDEDKRKWMADRGWVWLEGKWQKTEEPQEVRFGEGEV